MLTLSMRLSRVTVLLILLGGSLASAAGRVSAQELDGNEYTDEEYGWSVEYDDDFWTGEEVDEPTYRGLNLSFEAGFGTLAVYDNGETDPEVCLEATADDFAGSDVFTDFRPSRSIDPPETARDAEGGVFTTTYTSDDVELPLVFYIECRAVDGGTLNVQLAANEDAYEDSLPAFEELLAAIETGGGSSTRDDDTPETDDRDDTPEPDDDETPVAGAEIDGDTFTEPGLGYSVTWDDQVWDAEVLESGEIPGLRLTTNDEQSFYSTIVIDAADGYRGDDPEDCVTRLADAFGDFDGYSSLREARRVDGPEPPRDGAGTIYAFTYTGDDGDELELVAYIECRPIDDESMIRVSIQTNQETLEDNVESFQAALDGIEIDRGARADEETPDPDDEETPERDDNGGFVENDVDAGELDDDTFTDSSLNYSFTFDDRVWTAELLEDSATAGVFLSTDDEDLFATVTLDASLGYTGIDVEQCVEDIATGYEDFEGYSSLRLVRNADGPEPPRDGASGVYSFTFTYENGTEAELVAYIECRPIDDESMVRVTIQTTEESLAENVDVFQEVLDGIEIDGGGNDAPNETPETDDDTPETDDEQVG